uniref:Uncharacterized protein n=1 Tax=Serinus canaria TaxID=9135 RepID=A0A8C9KVS7_SERCA
MRGWGYPFHSPVLQQGGGAGALPSLEDCLGFRWSLCCVELPLPLGALPEAGCVLALGAGPVTGPGTPGWETLPKFWCKASTRTGVTCATYIVSTVKLQLLVRQGRFSILNSCVLWAFRVTEERLAKKDAGTLRCGIRKGFFPLHESADVEVIITPDRSMQVFLIAAVIPALGARDHTEGGCFTLSVTGRRDPSCTAASILLPQLQPRRSRRTLRRGPAALCSTSLCSPDCSCWSCWP